MADLDAAQAIALLDKAIRARRTRAPGSLSPASGSPSSRSAT